MRRRLSRIRLSDLKQLLALPQAGEAKSRDAVSRAFKGCLGYIILSMHLARTRSDDVKAYGLTENRVQMGA